MMKLNSNSTFTSIKARPLQSLLLIISVIFLSSVFLGSNIINYSLDKGIKNMQQRLGADLMIVPEGAKETAEDILLEGSRGCFYFNSSVYNDIISADGIKEASPQFFLKSLSADCCSSELEIVFFDPETDFLIQPWISQSYDKINYSGQTAIIGNFISTNENNTITLFGREYPVSARMAKTGTSLDSSVYFTFDSIAQIVSDAEEKQSFLTDAQKNADIISTVFINTEDGFKISDIISSVRSNITEPVEFIYPKELTNSVSDDLKNIYNIIKITLVTVIFLVMIIMLVIYLSSVNDQKKEISLLRILGASQNDIFKIMMKESVVISLIGALTGCIITTVILIPFGNYIGNRLNMPYLGPDFLNIFTFYAETVLLSIITSMVASAYPVIHICRTDTYLALKKEGE